jgi:hypothetical protein
MNKIKIFKRFNVGIVPAFGFFIGVDKSGSIQILIGFVGIEYNYVGLCRKKIINHNFKPKNRF